MVQREPEGLPCTQGWILGEDSVSEDPPGFAPGGVLLHAPLIAERYAREVDRVPPFFFARAGTWATCGVLLHRLDQGELKMTSSVATSSAGCDYSMSTDTGAAARGIFRKDSL